MEIVTAADYTEEKFFRMQSTFPQHESGAPIDQPSDEEIWVDHTNYLKNEKFDAANAEEALGLYLEDIRTSGILPVRKEEME